MLILALDTTTRAGSLALLRDCTLLETFVGDAARTHATRLPDDILDCLARHGLHLGDLELYAVAAGPGSFTGIRIGIATIQGLAFPGARPVAAISALDALVEALGPTSVGPPHSLRAAWMDAQRGEVYACLYRPAGEEWTQVTPPVVGHPAAVLADWRALDAVAEIDFVGDGALAYSEVIESALTGRVRIVNPVPPLAPAVARLAAAAARAGRLVAPHAIRPIYIRRPDVELVRDRRAGLGG